MLVFRLLHSKVYKILTKWFQEFSDRNGLFEFSENSVVF